MSAARTGTERPSRARHADHTNAGSPPAATWPTSQLRPHAHTDLLPEPSGTSNREFHDDIRERGVATPLEITPTGTVLNGTRRLKAATELAIPELPVRIVTASDEFDYIIRAALHQRHLTQSQRAARVSRQFGRTTRSWEGVMTVEKKKAVAAACEHASVVLRVLAERR